jgi:antitoxin component of MazEF toxin-antitoxin module
MAKALIGKWGKNFAVRFPTEVAQAMDFRFGEEIEFEKSGPDLVIRRPDARTRAKAQKAADEIIKERRNYSLGKMTVRELIGRDRH